VNPATGKTIAQIPAGDVLDIDKAVKYARMAYDNVWSKTNPADRGILLYKLAGLIDTHRNELARLDSIDAGKPIADCRADVSAAISIVRFFAGLPDKIHGHTIPVQQGYTTYTLREPYGVVGAITPWNYPFYLACGKVAPILAMGNTCILKPAEQTPLSALRLGKLAQEAGFPAGVLNVVTGLGESAGAALANHMDVDKISFTGSTEVGRLIMEASARSNLKPVTLELGGKSPNIIFADANLEAALDAAAFIVFYNQGQTCTAATRLIVQDKIADQVIAGLIDRAKRVKVGDPLLDETHLGAIISKEQYDKVQSYIRRGRDEGAKLVIGGEPPLDSHLGKGFFLTPTIFTDVQSNMSIAQEEIFGPVLSVLRFNTEDEAIRLANDVTYGLAASVWTQDASRLLRVINAIKSGLVWANCVFIGNPAVPVGGYKQSGFGKEYGLDAGLEYTRQKTVWINATDSTFRWLG
jgi:aldehyde dehydrogenase (NAD+)